MAFEDEDTTTVAVSVLVLISCLADAILSRPAVDGVRVGPIFSDWRLFSTDEFPAIYICILYLIVLY